MAASQHGHERRIRARHRGRRDHSAHRPGDIWRKGLMHDFLNKLISSAQQTGYHLYLVGGGVRDELMGRELHDFDLTTDAPVSAIKDMLEWARPDTIYTLGEKFGTIGAIVGDSTG